MNSRSTYTPYTYLIGWSDLNLWYYGSRYAKESKCLYETGCHPNDFWVTYHTSSDYVEEARKIHGEPDVRKIRKTFATAEETRRWEKKVLKKLPLGDGSPWLNVNRGSGPEQTEGVKRKIGEAMKGKTPWNAGKKTGPPSEETKRKMSKSQKGRKHTEEHRRRISEAKKGNKWWNNGEEQKLKKTCPGPGWVQGMIR